MNVDEFLEHHGVKGQKWGVRRAEKRAAKADAKWQNNIYSVHGAVAVHNAVADRMNNGGLDRLNNQPKYKNAKQLIDWDTGQPVGVVGKQYMHDYEKLTEQYTKEAVSQVHGISPSGKYQAKLDTSTPDWSVKVSPVDVHHADVPLPELTMLLDHDDKGVITYSLPVKDSTQHSADPLSEFLSHHGVKGMKWGIRKRSTGTKGFSKDAKRATSIHKKGKTNPVKVKALSNQEIETFLKRARLESQFKEATPGPGKKALNMVKFLLGTGKTVNEAANFANTNAVSKAMSKKKEAQTKSS